MRHAVAMFLLIATALATLLVRAAQPAPQQSPEEAVLRAAGLSTDGDAVLEFFRQRTQPTADLDKLVALARQLGDEDAQTRSNAAAKLVAIGPWAMPALRHVANELDNPLAAKEARRCLEWIAGPKSREVPIAAARLLAALQPAAATATLLAFLPVADDQAVVDAVKGALASIAARPGKADAALLAALQDPLPLRRAVAVEVLAASGHPEVLPEVRKLLADPMAQVRLRSALALTQRNDEKAVEVLIDLLAELSGGERLLAEQTLQQLAGEWSPALALQGDDALSRKVRREAWAGWWRTMDGLTLLAALRQRMLNIEGETEKLPSALPRLLAVRKPAGAAEALLAFLPLAEDRSMKEEIGKALKGLVLVDGQPDPAVLKALTDPLAVRRIAAAAALAGAGGAAHPVVRKLLTEGDPEVRLRVAMAFINAHDKEAIPALIDLVAELPRSQTAEALELLRRLAGSNAPAIPPGDDEAARKMLREPWLAWWKDHGPTLNLTDLGPEKAAPVQSGTILVAELASKGAKVVGKKGAVVNPPAAAAGGVPVQPLPGVQPVPAKAGWGRIVAIDRSGKTLWQIEDLEHPIDFQMLPGDRVLVAEYTAKRVTERDLKGKILWEVNNLPNFPMNVQRLANGNTFIALYGTPAATGGYLLMEVDRQGKTVATFNGLANKPKGNNPRAAYKMADGQMICLIAGGTCVRLDATGKEIKRFTVPLASVGGVTGSVGNIEVTSKGHLVVVQNNNMVAEYDPDGKLVWQANATGNRATRLPNGNTLVASEATGVVELDNAGKTVWQYQPPAGYQAVRARPIDDLTVTPPPAPGGAPAANFGKK